MGAFVRRALVVRTAGLAVVLAYCLAPVSAQHPVQMSFTDAVAKARAVVAARVLDVRVEDHGWIQTVVDFETFAVGKGDSLGKFSYRMMGGRIGTTQTVSGEPLPRFTRGEEVVLLVAPQVAPDGNPTLYRRHIYRIARSPSGSRVVTAVPADLPRSSRSAAAVAGASDRVPLDEFMDIARSIR